jgi:hypothetical protein
VELIFEKEMKNGGIKVFSAVLRQVSISTLIFTLAVNGNIQAPMTAKMVAWKSVAA